VTRPRIASRAVLIGVATAFATALSVTIARLVYRAKPTLGSVDFGFGPLVDGLLAGRGLCAMTGDGPDPLCSHRAPLVPLFLAAVGSFANSTIAALLIKNALLATLATLTLAPIVVSLLDGLPSLSPTQRRLLLALGVLTTVLSAQVLLTSGEIAYEEGYTTWLVAIAFGVVLAPEDPPLATRAAAWVCVAALPVIKSSMLPVALVLALQLSLRERRSTSTIPPPRRALRSLAPIALLAVAISAWTIRNGLVSGRFWPGTSWDGRNFWKGNNAFVAEYYPERSLDAVADEQSLYAPRNVRGEWARSDYARDQGLAFVRAHPWRTVLDAGLKARVFALDLREARKTGERTSIETAKDVVQVPAMLATRVVWLAALVAAVAMVARRGPTRGTAVRYLAFVGAFALPYVVGFACVRHFVPVVVPTWLFVLRALGTRPGNLHGSESPIRACHAWLG
jgi:hypothetical protein